MADLNEAFSPAAMYAEMPVMPPTMMLSII